MRRDFAEKISHFIVFVEWNLDAKIVVFQRKPRTISFLSATFDGNASCAKDSEKDSREMKNKQKN